MNNKNQAEGEEAGERMELRSPESSSRRYPEEEDETTEVTQCGFGAFRPRFLQFAANRNCLLFWMCWFCIVQGMLVNGLVPSVLSTLERRFGLTGSQLAKIMQCYDIGYVLACIGVSYFGGRHSKPLYLAVGLLLVSCGSFIFTLPHLLSPRYLYETEKSESHCQMTNNETIAVAEPLEGPYLSSRGYLFIFCIAHFIHGVGSTPLFTLAVSYIDENVKPALSSLYMGVFYTFAVFGPAIGFIMSSGFLRFHTDFLQEEGMKKISSIHSESDPAWVGAWWIGFYIVCVAAVLGLIPILSFPRVLPESVEWQKARENLGHYDPFSPEESKFDLCANEPPTTVATRKPSRIMGDHETLGEQLKDDVKHIPVAVKELLTNVPFMLITIAASFDALLITGLSTYMPSYLEKQFNVKASRSNMLIGCILVPVAGIGTLFSGYLVKQYRMTCRNTIKFTICMVIVCLMLCPMFLIYCDHTKLIGVEAAYPLYGNNDSKQLISSCNQNCGCAKSSFNPICVNLTDTYYSPCHAGCLFMAETDEGVVYGNCTCLPNQTADIKTGWCEEECGKLVGFLILFAPMILCTFCIGVPLISVVLRCVEYSERSFALGIQWILVRCIGTIPAQALFAWLFDISCLSRKESELTGGCLVHNNTLLGDLFMAFSLIMQALTLIFLVLALIFYKERPSSTQNQPQSPIGT